MNGRQMLLPFIIHNLSFIIPLPGWRNWQTLRSQKPLVEIPCEFESHPGHQDQNENEIKNGNVISGLDFILVLYLRLILFTHKDQYE